MTVALATMVAAERVADLLVHGSSHAAPAGLDATPRTVSASLQEGSR